jgi:hypothetical protein
MNTIRVELDSVKKCRGLTEYHWIPRARVGDLEVVGFGEVIKQVLTLFHENNPGINSQVEVYRGDTLCFMPMALNSWLFPPDRRPEWLKK